MSAYIGKVKSFWTAVSAYIEAWQSLEDLDTTVIGGLWMRYDRFKPLYNVGLKWVTEPSTIFSC